MLTKNNLIERVSLRKRRDLALRTSIRKKNIGNITIVLLVGLTILLWVAFPPPPHTDDNAGRNYPRQFAGEMIGSVMIVLMSCSLFLAARPRWAESFFGGLDRMYLTHRRCSESAFLLMFAHVLTVPISTHRPFPLGGYLALIAFPGIVTIVLVTIAPRITLLNNLIGRSYQGWKKLHRYIGIFFILGYLHSLTLGSLANDLIRDWLNLFFFLGTASYLYTEIFARFLRRSLPYTVEAVNHPNPSTAEVIMRPIKRAIQIHHAGQFLFARFKTPGLDESHPFTISSASGEYVLRLTIQASGDFTRHLCANLKPGTDAVIEGPYGMFDYKAGGSQQIWLAGGIGVTPFLAFIRDLKTAPLDRDIKFHYIVHHRDEAVFVEEIEATARQHPRLKVYLHFTATQGPVSFESIYRKTGGDLVQHHVYMCCPMPMKLAFEKKFRKAGVLAGNIHFEEFSFR